MIKRIFPKNINRLMSIQVILIMSKKIDSIRENINLKDNLFCKDQTENLKLTTDLYNMGYCYSSQIITLKIRRLICSMTSEIKFNSTIKHMNNNKKCKNRQGKINITIHKENIIINNNKGIKI